MKYTTFVTLALALAVSALPAPRASFTLENGQKAIALNEKFKTLTEASSCQSGDQACINGGFALCDNGKFVLQGCGAGTVCAALPLVNSPGTSISCDTQSDIDSRIAATGATSSDNNSGSGAFSAPADASTTTSAAAASTSAASSPANTVSSATPDNPDIQNSLTLDSSQIATGFLNDGQQGTPEPGQVASLTSGNNFINFCATSSLPLTNGLQVTGGSCNPAVMGEIPSTDNMVSAKFTNPINGQTIAANQAFTISVAMNGLSTGFFVNAKQNYFAAPQKLNDQGQIQGHSHVVVEQLDSLTQTTPTDPTKFAFFKGLNAAAVNGVLTAEVAAGLPAGVYKVSTINTAANHQPVLLPIAQHGSPEDVVYFTVA